MEIPTPVWAACSSNLVGEHNNALAKSILAKFPTTFMFFMYLEMPSTGIHYIAFLKTVVG